MTPFQKGSLMNRKNKIANLFENKITLAAPLLIIILGFTIYANSLDGKFIWDDEYLVEKNIFIRNWSNLAKIFTSDPGAGGGKVFHCYRPLWTLSHMTDYFIWGLDSRGYHFTNILLHILVALCIYRLIYILYNDKVFSLLTGLFFVVHPIHSETVNYISCRTDLLGSLFLLLSFIFYIKQLRSNSIKVYILMVLSYLLALLSRENSLILPVLLLLYHYTFREKIKSKEFFSILGAAFVYIALRVTVLRELLLTTPSYVTVIQRLPGFFVAISSYMRLFFMPFGLHMEYGNSAFPPADPKAIIGVVIAVLSITYAWGQRTKNRLIFFSIFWFFIALLPVSNIYPINAYMAEHWLYLPSVGFFLILAYGLGNLLKTEKFKAVAVIIITALIVFCSYLTIMQADYWNEPITFYERSLQYAPDSPRINNNLGALYANMGKYEEAMPFLQKAIQTDPAYAEAYYNFGTAYQGLGRTEEAIASYKKAIRLNLNYEKAYVNLAVVYYGLNKIEEAITLYRKALQINPHFAEAYNNLGLSYAAIGKNEEAIGMFKKAVEVNPPYAEVYYNLGKAYNDIGMKDKAIMSFKKAIDTDPNYAKAYNSLGVMYVDTGRMDEAITMFKKTTELDPRHAMAYCNLSRAYFQRKEYDLAIEYCDKAKNLGLSDLPFLKDLEPYRK